MPKYTFTFKKDDIFVEFFTADRDIVERQFQIWVSDADDYVNNRKSRPITQETTVPVETPSNEVKEEAKSEPQEEPEPAQNIAEQEPEEVIIEQTLTQQEEPIAEPTIEPVIEPISEEIIQTQAVVESSTTIESEIEQEHEVEKAPEVLSEPEKVEPEVFDKASTLLRTINEIQNTDGVSIEEKVAEAVDFESVLEQSLENPTFEPSKIQDQVFLNLIKSKKAQDKFSYLLITAYYLSEFEKMERFSLKQINAKLMHNLALAIDHGTLQDAINQKLIELIPDLTGTSEVAEYRLTRLGEEFFATKM